MRSLCLFAVALVLGACSLRPGDVGREADTAAGTFPAACRDFDLTDRQCGYIVDRLGEGLGVDRSRTREIQLLGDPGCDADPGVNCVRSTRFVVRVRFVGEDGGWVEDSQFCSVGGDVDLACTDPPLIRVSAPTVNGYDDVPCTGEPPDGCATPVPTIDPAVRIDGRELRIASLDVPLDHLGQYTVPLGTAVLPNGVLTETTFSLADDRQRTFLLRDGTVRLVVTGDDNEPIWNVYEQGWRPGTQTVDVRLEFEVEDIEAGAVLQVRDLVVR